MTAAEYPESELEGSPSGTPIRYFNTRLPQLKTSAKLSYLVDAHEKIKVDMVGLAQMVAASGPIGGRTIYQDLRRLQPGETLQLKNGRLVRGGRWTWEDIATRNDDPRIILEALVAEVQKVTKDRHVVSMLSGGWDSRLLAALAKYEAEPQTLRALTTSSDTGTVMEELVATQVAADLGIDHEVIFPRRDTFAQDFQTFVEAVEYQTNFHVWLVPLARALNRDAPSSQLPLVLDGLGGGLFVGGAFADPIGKESLAEKRLSGVTKYLAGATSVLKPKVIDSFREAIVTDAKPVVQRYLGHPYGNILSAYLTRTLPGISMAPHGLIADFADVATPFVSPEVVEAGLSLDPTMHSNDRLYPILLERISPSLANLTTAQQQVPWPRPHPRRITSIEAITFLRNLVVQEPVVRLLSPRFVDAGPQQWRKVLSQTGGQHLLRGLATLSLWWQNNQNRVVGFDVTEWLR